MLETAALPLGHHPPHRLPLALIRSELLRPKPSPPRTHLHLLPSSALGEYINSLKTSGKSESNILDVLTTCFKEPAEEIAEISTPGALDF